MLFRSDFAVTGLRLSPRGDEGGPDYPLVFDYGTLRVELAPPTDTEEKSGYSRDTGVGSATLERTPPRKVVPMLEALARGEFPEGSNPERDRDYFDATTGRMVPKWVLPLRIMPPAFIDFAHEVRKELRSFASRTVRVLRWRLDHEGPHNPFATRGDSWSFDGEHWERMPEETSLLTQQLWSLAPQEAALRDVSLSEREHDAVIDYCASEGIVFVPLFPLKGDGGRVLEQIAEQREATPTQIVLAWLLRRSPVMLPIPGSLSIEHVRANLAALEIGLTDAEFDAL